MKFLHTADWQLGLKLNFIPGESGSRARQMRFEAVRTLAKLAKENAVDAVLVAGDVLDDNAVGPDTLQQTRDALEKFAPIPVFLLPGNHDAVSQHQNEHAPQSALLRLNAGSHVHIISTTETHEIGNAVIHPCPLTQRHSMDDPTLHLPSVTDDSRIHIAVGHGGTLDLTEEANQPNLINPKTVEEKGYAYLALGDWHGVKQISNRCWYSGAPEATRFKEKKPGFALLVEINTPSEQPVIKQLPVAETRWIRIIRTLENEADLDAFFQEFKTIEEPSRTLVSLELDGLVTLSGQAHLESFLEEQAQRLLHLRIKTMQIHQQPSPDDLAAMQTEGFVQSTIEQLHQQGSEQSADALVLLHRIMMEQNHADA
ncbi:MAG: DNA repair exonuclease [Magnetococcales bacterium]|nr:DNA repair exonuclease [Magnetococcales bacterium]